MRMRRAGSIALLALMASTAPSAKVRLKADTTCVMSTYVVSGFSRTGRVQRLLHHGLLCAASRRAS